MPVHLVVRCIAETSAAVESHVMKRVVTKKFRRIMPQVCGAYPGTFFPLLEFDAYRVFSGQWEKQNDGKLPGFKWGNGTQLDGVVFPRGLNLPLFDQRTCTSSAFDCAASSISPWLTTSVRQLNTVSSRAILTFFVVMDVADSWRYIVSALVWSCFDSATTICLHSFIEKQC